MIACHPREQSPLHPVQLLRNACAASNLYNINYINKVLINIIPSLIKYSNLQYSCVYYLNLNNLMTTKFYNSLYKLFRHTTKRNVELFAKVQILNNFHYQKFINKSISHGAVRKTFHSAPCESSITFSKQLLAGYVITARTIILNSTKMCA